MNPTPEAALRFHVQFATDQLGRGIETWREMERTVGIYNPTPIHHAMRFQLALWIMTMNLWGFSPKPSGRSRGRLFCERCRIDRYTGYSGHDVRVLIRYAHKHLLPGLTRNLSLHEQFRLYDIFSKNLDNLFDSW